MVHTRQNGQMTLDSSQPDNADILASKENRRICIGVSSCLLGHQVRYDGKHKYHENIANRLGATFHCLPICPEVAIGLGVPRDPIKLVEIDTRIHAVGVNDNNRDVTAALLAYAEFVIQQHPLICGYVFKSRSPSCALNTAPLTSADNRILGTTSGIYARQLLMLLPELPVIEETALADPESMSQFIQSVERYSGQTRRIKTGAG